MPTPAWHDKGSKWMPSNSIEPASNSAMLVTQAGQGRLDLDYSAYPSTYQEVNRKMNENEISKQQLS
jgi:hypothetical protein